MAVERLIITSQGLILGTTIFPYIVRHDYDEGENVDEKSQCKGIYHFAKDSDSDLYV